MLALQRDDDGRVQIALFSSQQLPGTIKATLEQEPMVTQKRVKELVKNN